MKESDGLIFPRVIGGQILTMEDDPQQQRDTLWNAIGLSDPNDINSIDSKSRIVIFRRAPEEIQTLFPDAPFTKYGIVAGLFYTGLEFSHKFPKATDEEIAQLTNDLSHSILELEGISPKLGDKIQEWVAKSLIYAQTVVNNIALFKDNSHFDPNWKMPLEPPDQLGPYRRAFPNGLEI